MRVALFDTACTSKTIYWGVIWCIVPVYDAWIAQRTDRDGHSTTSTLMYVFLYCYQHIFIQCKRRKKEVNSEENRKHQRYRNLILTQSFIYLWYLKGPLSGTLYDGVGKSMPEILLMEGLVGGAFFIVDLKRDRSLMVAVCAGRLLRSLAVQMRVHCAKNRIPLFIKFSNGVVTDL